MIYDNFKTADSVLARTIKKPEDLVSKDLDEIIGQFQRLQLTNQLLLLL